MWKPLLTESTSTYGVKKLLSDLNKPFHSSLEFWKQD